MLPPSSLICSVTTASPIHTMAKMPLKTTSLWASRALKLSSRLSSRQKIRGPHRSQSRRAGRHGALADQRLDVHDAAGQPGELLARARQAGAAQVGIGAAQPVAGLEGATAEHVARVQHLAHLGPHRQQVAPQRVPHRLVDRVGRRPPVLARYPRCQVVFVEPRRRRADVARQRRPRRLRRRERVVEVVEVGWAPSWLADWLAG